MQLAVRFSGLSSVAVSETGHYRLRVLSALVSLEDATDNPAWVEAVVTSSAALPRAELAGWVRQEVAARAVPGRAYDYPLPGSAPAEDVRLKVAYSAASAALYGAVSRLRRLEAMASPDEIASLVSVEPPAAVASVRHLVGWWCDLQESRPAVSRLRRVK
jgi:hypothetical protein